MAEFGSWSDEDVQSRMGTIMANLEAEGKGEIFREGHPWHMPGYVSHVTIGQDAPDPAVYSLDGSPRQLSAVTGAAPTVLNLGSYT
jgi:hypothetical protein